MKLYRAKDYNEMSKIAANIIAAQVITKPDCVLGLATGSTPIGTYEKLVEKYEALHIKNYEFYQQCGERIYMKTDLGYFPIYLVFGLAAGCLFSALTLPFKPVVNSILSKVFKEI